MLMNEKELDIKAGTKDRKLGDEWLDWDGTTRPGENETDEKPGTFFALALGSVLIVIACILAGWYLAKPRIDQFGPLSSDIIEWFVLVLAAIIFVLAALETILILRYHTSIFPYVWTERLLLSLLSKSMWLGPKLGISKDRVGNSFIKAHNLVVKSHAREINTNTLLVLLPRCLQREARQQIAERMNGKDVKIVTAAGGEEARKAIRQYRPSLILAVACERDLISGIRDVARKVHVLAIPNLRPEGPCKNTHLSLDAFDEALHFITEKGIKAAKP
jgi:hypothetical protein